MWMGGGRYIASWGCLLVGYSLTGHSLAGHSLASKLLPGFLFAGRVAGWLASTVRGLLAIGFVNLYRRKTISAHNLPAALDAIRPAQYPPAATAQMHFW